MQITFITCIKSDTQDWRKTWDSLKGIIGGNIFWIIKLSQYCSESFVLEFPSNANILVVRSDDSGLYDGLNKALVKVVTKYYCVLGAGDCIADSFEDIKKQIMQNPDADAYFFATESLEFNMIMAPNPKEINVRMSCPHPSAILSRDISIKIGGYSRKYDIASDYDHMCRYLKVASRCFYSNTVLTKFQGGGVSTKKYFEAYLEEELIRIRNFESSYMAIYGRLLQQIAPRLSKFISLNFK